MEPHRRIRSDLRERTVAPFNKGPVRRARARLEVLSPAGCLVAHCSTSLKPGAAGASHSTAPPRYTVIGRGRTPATAFIRGGRERNAIRVAQHVARLRTVSQRRRGRRAAPRASPPTRPEPWRIAAELARIGGQRDKALGVCPTGRLAGAGRCLRSALAGPPRPAQRRRTRPWRRKSALDQQPPDRRSPPPPLRRSAF